MGKSKKKNVRKQKKKEPKPPAKNVHNKSDQEDNKEKPKKEKNPICEEIETFIKHLDALYGSIPLTMAMADVTNRMALEEYQAQLEKYGELEKEEENSKTYKILPHNEFKLKAYKKAFEQTTVAADILPQNYIVSFISQYDAFLGRLVKCLLKAKPDLLNSTEKQITFSELSTFDSIDDAVEHILEKETESLLRKSHHDQFDWLEKKFDIKLRKNLEIWPTFVEITQRRNLFVHCNGIVSNQYLNLCRTHKVKDIDKIKLGDRLKVDPEYVNGAYKCLFEIGVKLSQVLWRKILPDEIKAAEEALILNTYDLLCYEYYDIAKIMLDFAAVELPRHSDEESKRTHIINRAQAYKFGGDEEKCKKIIEEHDWSASNDKFQICLHVLNDEFEKASEVMVKLGADSDISKSAYYEWPIFKEYRKTNTFEKTFEKVFGEPPTKLSKVKTIKKEMRLNMPLPKALEKALLN